MGRKTKADADKLEAYRRKRSANRTPEPFGAVKGDRPRLYVIQKHAATSMHYDLRLEMEGALQSWAVPKGPSLDPEVKRLAMEVEEHPLEYADFEGIIPEGNYGAGAVIVWDKGRWEPIDHDPVEGLKDGKLLFDLHGYKLRGRWTLFRTSKGKQNEWLLMKKPDAEADPEAELNQASIRSGLTVEELRDGVDPAKKVLQRIRRAKAPKHEVDPTVTGPMLAQTQEVPFSRKGWIFELKYDGYRLMGDRRDGAPHLRYRKGGDVTPVFPELAMALEALPFDDLILDGEVVVLNPLGHPSFQRLQQRARLSRRPDIQRATVQLPATWFVFDLLAFDGYDLRSLPLVERKKLLRMVLPPAGPLRYSDHIERQGEAMFAQVRKMGLEGIMAKRADSRYVSDRSPDWLKMRADRTADFAVVGYSPPKRGRSGFGALHLAWHDGERLVYAGRVGTGFTTPVLKSLQADLDRTRRPEPACVGSLPEGTDHTWVEPLKVVEVRYKQWTAAAHLRHPVFLREREDKTIEECQPLDQPVTPEPLPDIVEEPVERVVSFTNRDKIFWPEEGYSKGDLIDYYRAISSWIMPYLEDRPVVLTRYPDGIHGKNFFQKDAPSYIPDWVRTETMWSEHAKREIHYFICDDEESLLYLINLGTIPLHLWSSRFSTLQNPDWCILDLDPKNAPFEHVIRIARAIRKLCTEIGLDGFVKTSGSSGLHVLLPLGGQVSYEQSRTLGELLARVIVTELPKIATIIRSPAKREGKVYVDFLQNGHGRLLVSPFCVRPLPGAPCSAPLRWSEVRKGLSLANYTIGTMPGRMKRLKRDPNLDVLQVRPDLHDILTRLGQRLQ